MKKLMYLALLMLCACSKESNLKSKNEQLVKEKFAQAKINVLSYEKIDVGENATIEFVDVDFVPKQINEGKTITMGTVLTANGESHYNIVQFVSKQQISSEELKSLIIASYSRSLKKKTERVKNAKGYLSFYNLKGEVFYSEYFLDGKFECPVTLAI